MAADEERERKAREVAARAKFKKHLKPEEAEALAKAPTPPVTGEQPGKIVYVPPTASPAKAKADEFLKRIEFAIQYASDENIYALEIQVHHSDTVYSGTLQ